MSARAIAIGSAAILLLAACSSSKTTASSGGTSSPASSTAAVAAGSTVTVSIDEGHLVGPNGHVLYANTVDTTSSIQCTGMCATNWPPLAGTPAAGTGIDASKLGTAKRADGTTQVTYAGHPLYAFKQDSGSDDKYGQGLADGGGRWGIVSAAGMLDTSTSTGGESPSTSPTEQMTSGGY